MRVIAWFSCGASSAVAAKLAVEEYGDECQVVYCDTMSTEHPDNQRFFNDVRAWIGKPIVVIRSSKYRDVDDVFMAERYMAGIKGARCTVEMKKVPRFDYQRPDDVHIMGYTVDEQKRIALFQHTNPELLTQFILAERGFTKMDCLAEIANAGIVRPAMYRLGFEHNNCLACPKATSPQYWNRTRRTFPDVFARRAAQSRELGVRLVRVKGKRIFLDELDPQVEVGERATEDIECGPMCIAGGPDDAER